MLSSAARIGLYAGAAMIAAGTVVVLAPEIGAAAATTGELASASATSASATEAFAAWLVRTIGTQGAARLAALPAATRAAELATYRAQYLRTR
jgi:hypothetical protein